MKAGALQAAAEAYARQRNRKTMKDTGKAQAMSREPLAIVRENSVTPPSVLPPPTPVKEEDETEDAEEAAAAAPDNATAIALPVTLDGAASCQAVVISGTLVVRHLEGRPFTLYQLHVPLVGSEHVAFRRCARKHANLLSLALSFSYTARALH